MGAPTIALLTDFGTQDTYVGVMKGVIARIAPQAQVIDLTHSIPAGDIRQAAFKLWQAIPYFPSGTVFLTVVDPGVGTERLPVAVAWPDFAFVGPDNGLLTYLLAQGAPRMACRLQSPAYRLATVSSTFHGRDLFSPAAAHLALGVSIADLGPPVADLARFPLPRLELVEGPAVKGEILHADHFGNLITSLGILRADGDELVLEPWLPHCAPARLPLADLSLRLPNGASLNLRATFGDVAIGQALGYIGSEGLLEIAINRGRAADVLPLAPRQEVTLGYTPRIKP
jgi:S-adenosylmethionine hydrolase